MRPAKRNCNAFTLVELLVVVGIIALLIGILLPTLSRARQSANSVDCLSSLRQMGQGINLYADQNDGQLPMGFGPYGERVFNGSRQPVNTTWELLVTSMLDEDFDPALRGAADMGYRTAEANKVRQIFEDKDTVDVPVEGRVTGFMHYSSHPRLMPSVFTNDPAPGAKGKLQPYKLGSIRRGAEIILAMDGVQGISTELPAHQGKSRVIAWKLDENAIFGPTYLLEEYLEGTDAVAAYNASIDGGPNLHATGNAGPRWGNIAWRHMNSTQGNFLFVDGHAEARHYESRQDTGVLQKNICVNR